MKEKQVWRTTLEDGSVHLRIGAIGEFGSERRSTTFKLESRFAIRAAEIKDRGVPGKSAERVGRAARTVEFSSGPGLAGDARALRGAFVILRRPSVGRRRFIEKIRSRSPQGLKAKSYPSTVATA